MLMADNGWFGGDLSAGDECGDDHDLSIDIGTLLDMLGDEKEPDRVQVGFLNRRIWKNSD